MNKQPFPQQFATQRPRRLVKQPQADSQRTPAPALTQEQIKEKLSKYTEVSSIDSVSLSTHVRYYVYDKNTKAYVFRSGGLLYMKQPEYVVLSNGQYSWSVPKAVAMDSETHPTRFYRILNKDELKDKQFTQTKSTLEQENETLRKMIEDFKRDMEAKQKETISVSQKQE